MDPFVLLTNSNSRRRKLGIECRFLLRYTKILMIILIQLIPTCAFSALDAANEAPHAGMTVSW